MSGNLDFELGQVSGLKGEDGQLTHATIKGSEGEVDIPVTRMLPFFGLDDEARTDCRLGSESQRESDSSRTEKFETSEPGIFAIGDINSIPAS